MDPLSITVSVVALLDSTAKVIGYLKDVKDAPKECGRCQSEASNLYSLLLNLAYHVNTRQAADGDWYTAVQALDGEQGPIDQYKEALAILLSRVESHGGYREVKKRLLWKFSKAEVNDVLSRMERLKSLVAVALEMDHL